MRIAVICKENTPHDIRFMNMFLEAGHVVGRIVLEHVAENDALPPGVHYIWQPRNSASGLGSPERVHATSAALGAKLRAFAPDVVFAGPLDSAGYTAVLMDVAPVVAACWGFDILLHAEQDPAARRAISHTLSHAQGVLVDSEFLAQRVLALGFPHNRPMTRAPFGVDLPRYAPGPQLQAKADALRAALGLGSQNILICTNRNHAPLYRPDVVIRAFALALGQQPNLFLHIAGQGELTHSLKSLARQLGAAERIHFAGWLQHDEIPHFLAASDIYVSASSVDGSSVSLMQAMALGLPVIATDIPGNREWVEACDCGLLTPVGDNDALAHALRQLAEMRPDERRALGAKGRQHAMNNADWRQNAQRIVALVESVATQSPAMRVQ